MKKQILLTILIAIAVSSCGLFHKTEKYGCPSNGKNVDAGKLAAGDPKAIKAAKNAPKFIKTKF